MRIANHIAARIADALCLPQAGVGVVLNALAPTPSVSVGDVAFRGFDIAAERKRSPTDLVRSIAAALAPDPLIRSFQAVGPYLNITLHRGEAFRLVLEEILAQNDRFGATDVGKGGVIVLDFSAPNLAKPFHFGHLRSTDLGAIMARIWEFLGYRVWRQNYLGDWGTQFGFVIYAWSHFGDENELQSRAVDYLVELYVRANRMSEDDPSVREEARALFRKLEDEDPEITALWTRFRNLSVASFERTYKRLGVQFDTYDGEAAMKDKVGPVIDRFVSAGVARESRGALIVEVSDVLGRPLAPCMLRKSDGATTYAARDCAAAIDRWQKHGFLANVYVCARQEDHFAQVFAALKKLAIAEKWDVCWPDRCENVSFGYVKGMSTRKGNAVWLDDVLNEAADRARQVRENRRSATPDTYPDLPAAELDELCEAVGLGAVLFFDVSSNRLTDVTFDWDTVLQFDGKTGPYLQYTHARIAGLFRKAHAAGLGVDSPPTTALMSNLTSDEEWQLLFALRSFASEVCNAGEAREPRIVADYLFGLAGAFNRFYQKHPILHASDADTAVARLCLVRATQIVLRNGLRLLGIPAVEVM